MQVSSSLLTHHDAFNPCSRKSNKWKRAEEWNNKQLKSEVKDYVNFPHFWTFEIILRKYWEKISKMLLKKYWNHKYWIWEAKNFFMCVRESLNLFIFVVAFPIKFSPFFHFQVRLSSDLRREWIEMGKHQESTFIKSSFLLSSFVHYRVF